MRNNIYFTEIQKDYRRASEYSQELYRNIAVHLNSILSGNVIDIGNGGIINYETQSIEKLICIDIIFKKHKITDKKIDFIYGDFYQIDLPGKVDYILTQFILHHLTDDIKLKKAIIKINRKLHEKGSFIVVEIAVPRWVEVLQNLWKNVIFVVLRLMRKPGLRFFSEKSLVELLRKCGFKCIHTTKISIGKKVSPAPVLFPKLRIPGKLYPFSCILIEARNTM